MLNLTKIPEEYLLQVYPFNTDNNTLSPFLFPYLGRIERRIKKDTKEEIITVYIKDNADDEVIYNDFKSMEEAEQFVRNYIGEETNEEFKSN